MTSNHLLTRINIQGTLQRNLGFTSVLGKPDDVIIDHACWIGDRVLMLPGSKVGIGCVVGAGAVVTKEFPPFSIIAGNPARTVRMRFDHNVIQFILRSRWWEWSEERMRRNKNLFESDLTTICNPLELEDLGNE